MSITSSGPVCDICGNFILPELSESVNPFKCKGIDRTLHCHDECRPKALKAMEKNDWKLLPEGPLREAFERAAKEE